MDSKLDVQSKSIIRSSDAILSQGDKVFKESVRCTFLNFIAGDVCMKSGLSLDLI